MGQACLADFGLIGIISDGTNIVSSASFAQGGTQRWMSPELFDPEKFDLNDGRPTKHSDCYALGMVIYEVLSGEVPFSTCSHHLVVVKVLAGERPARPQGTGGAWFMDGVWEILERCWVPQPENRPNIEDVLRCLEKVSMSRSNTSASFSATQKRLEGLDPSDVQYRPLLYELLSHQDLTPHVRGLRGPGLEEFVELLDEVREVDIDIHRC